MAKVPKWGVSTYHKQTKNIDPGAIKRIAINTRKEWASIYLELALDINHLVSYTYNMKEEFKILKKFVSEEERKELAEWILNNKDTPGLFRDAGMKGNRITTRYSEGFSFPRLAYKLKKRIREQLKFKNFKLPKYHDGIVASCAGENDTVFEHLDPQWYPPYETLHCNLMVQKPLAGGHPTINNEKIEVEERDLWCYYVSKVPHGSSKISGKRSRLMYVFGFCIEYKPISIC